jgi:NTE family protein
LSRSDETDRALQDVSPVRRIPGDPREYAPVDGIALCLSGGGYRAMLFHTGALWRLNELGYLPKLALISSVSGGSITAGVLACSWKHLSFSEKGVASGFEAFVVGPIRNLANRTIDWKAVLRGFLWPGGVSARIAGAYRKHLFHRSTLQDLPEEPRFVINATNLESGVLWRFSRPYMADYRVGKIKKPVMEVAIAVAASSAFPPFLSPTVLSFQNSDYVPGTGKDLQHEPFTTRPLLTDGGVYDNLGLETAWKRYRTVLISDGGGHIEPRTRFIHSWPFQSFRVLTIMNSQVLALRKKQAIASYRLGQRAGAYWGIRTHAEDYGIPMPLSCPSDSTNELAKVPTRLKRLDRLTQERLINWGYAVCDLAFRKHVDETASAPTEFPYAASGVG